MNSNDDISTNTAATPVSGAGEKTKKRSRKALIAWIAAGALVLGGGIAATAISVNSYNAETQSLCVAATDAAAQASTAAGTAQQAAADALLAVEDTELPDGAGTSTPYAERPAAEEIPAQKAEGDQPEVEAMPARPSGQELIEEVEQAQSALTKSAKSLVDTCETRDDAASAHDTADAVLTDFKALDEAVLALTGDFALFQQDEAARIAAEKKAAEEKAAAEAAAAAQAQAEAEAAQAAAEQWVDPGYGYTDYGNGGGSTGGGGGGGSWNPIDPNIGDLGRAPAAENGCWTYNCAV